MAELTLLEALRARAHELVERLDANAAIISRVLGDALIVVTQTALDDRALGLGQGFLVSDYPPTKRVLETGTAAVLTLDDPAIDEAEAAILRELGYATVLMLPFELAGTRWGLVEVYRTDARPFTPAEITVAGELSRLR